MAYLIKATLIWLVFLLIYEALLKNSARYLANRVWLCGGLLFGALLPLVRMTPSYVTNSRIVQSDAAQWVAGGVAAIEPVSAADRMASSVPWMQIITGIYLLGLAVLLVVSLREIGIILRHAIYSRFTVIRGSHVFYTERTIAPYSFMGWIFISRHTPYEEEELDYVLNHEDAHNRQRHWLDLLLMQCVCILFWFHPLVWRFRYLLRLQHEYEADAIAAADDAYSYGHFLLQQTLLKGTPFVAHSFHFSPIKNRINMLTRNTNAHSTWKYLAVIPAVFSCTFLMAHTGGLDERVRSGNKTSYKGNEFTWAEEVADTIVIQDPVTSEMRTLTQHKEPVILKMNGEAVIDNKAAGLQAQFRNENMSYSNYLLKQLTDRVKHIPDSIGQIQVNNIVVDKQGRIRYYELLFVNTKVTRANNGYTYHPELSPVMEQIIADAPNWLPASKDGQPVNAFIAQGGVASIRGISLTFQSTGPGQKVVNQKGTIIFEGKPEEYETTNPDGTKTRVKATSIISVPAPQDKPSK